MMTEQTRPRRGVVTMAVLLTLMILFFVPMMDGQDIDTSRSIQNAIPTVMFPKGDVSPEEKLDTLDSVDAVKDNGTIIAVAKRDARPGRPRCLTDEFWSQDYHRCMMCTRCSPGTEHKPAEPCGYGSGAARRCEPCRNGYYQKRDDYQLLRCKPCVTCDPRAVTLRACTVRSNTKCGPCPSGWFYHLPNSCLQCSATSDHPDCPQTLQVTSRTRPGKATSTPPAPVNSPTQTKPSALTPSSTSRPEQIGVHKYRFHVVVTSTLGVMLGVIVILVVVLIIACIRYRRRRQNGANYQQAPKCDVHELREFDGPPVGGHTTPLAVQRTSSGSPSRTSSDWSSLTGYSGYAARSTFEVGPSRSGTGAGLMPANDQPSCRSSCAGLNPASDQSSGRSSCAGHMQESDRSSSRPSCAGHILARDQSSGRPSCAGLVQPSDQPSGHPYYVPSVANEFAINCKSGADPEKGATPNLGFTSEGTAMSPPLQLLSGPDGGYVRRGPESFLLGNEGEYGLGGGIHDDDDDDDDVDIPSNDDQASTLGFHSLKSC